MIKEINCNIFIIKEFISEFLKEKRKLDLINQNDRLIIRRYSDGITAIEEEIIIIKYLKNKLLDIKIPSIINYENDYIDFEYIEGIRCFNLLIELKRLYHTQKNKMRIFQIARKILITLNQHLKLFQNTAVELKELVKIRNYPYESKSINALNLLSKIINNSRIDNEIADDIQSLSKLVNENCDVPFRDCTPKNTIIHFPELSMRYLTSEYQRKQKIIALIDHERINPELITNQIYHLDYSGFPFFCTHFDDWICLNFHESTQWLLDHNGFIEGPPENELFWATAIFRFLRLGARKLAYQLLSKNAANIRYKYENAAYYFRFIEMWILKLMQAGIIKGEKWLELNSSLITACSLTPNIDYLEYYNEISPSSYYTDVYPY